MRSCVYSFNVFFEVSSELSVTLFDRSKLRCSRARPICGACLKSKSLCDYGVVDASVEPATMSQSGTTPGSQLECAPLGELFGLR